MSKQFKKQWAKMNKNSLLESGILEEDIIFAYELYGDVDQVAQRYNVSREQVISIISAGKSIKKASINFDATNIEKSGPDYAAGELAGSFGLNAGWLRERAEKNGVDLKVYLMEADQKDTIEEKMDVIHRMMTELSKSASDGVKKSSINFDATNKEELRRAYQEAVSAGEESFYFDGSEILVSYAKYLLEYLDMTIKSNEGTMKKSFKDTWKGMMHKSDEVKKDMLGDIMAWEDGNMTEAEEIDFFQRLINSGEAWKLQGKYGRNAERLIEAGLCTDPRNRG
jgi:hypothetical protein